MSLRRPPWWPADLWPGGDRPRSRTGPAEGVASAGPPGEAGDRPAAREGWETFLDAVVSSLQPGRASLWSLGEGGERWRRAAAAVAEGWKSPGVDPFGAAGHPFTWALQEDLVLQVPSERLDPAGELDGWSVVAPVPEMGIVLSLWYSSPPSPAVRKAVPALRSHLRWIGRVEAHLLPGDGRRGGDVGGEDETFGAPGG